MKKILFILVVLIFNPYSIIAEEIKCNTALSKLNPKCNFIGKGMEKMKKFSEKNKTLDQSYENIKTTVEKKIKKK
tara:strand:+ start:77 stop:301 length:225 start_codon:yes stop_codon:yes gene_type:complete